MKTSTSLCYFSLERMGFSSYNNSWLRMRLRIQNGTATLTSRDDSTKTKSETIDDTPTRLRLLLSSNGISEYHIRNIAIY